MKTKRDIEDIVQTTLSSLDGLQQAPANEFLYTRVASRLQHLHDAEMGRGGKLLLRISLAMVLLFAVNVTALILLKDKSHSKAATGINAFASQYGLQQDTYSY